ncbi:L-threonylcarbamoyladenylate synthase [Enorma sp.]|uniref:L-threonylcarbamoyladenylate synthase n=1 Tax=Enorma sp. TaxID=1920692 RepID=UPI003AB4884E
MLSSGGLALIPTETVYGLAVAVAPFMQPGVAKGASREPSVNGAALPPASSGYRRIFTVKQRDLAQTVPWLVGGVDDLDRYGCAVDEVTRALADAFWPGALTLIVRANNRVPRFMQAADGTVALRCSASPVVAALIRACGCPLATTSANTHGMPAPASFDVVEPVVLAGVDVAIDAGETPCQDASTIVSCVSGEVVVARYGALSEDDIQRVAKTARMRMQDRQ